MTLLQLPTTDLFDKLSDKFFWRYGMNLFFMFVLVRAIYYPIYRRKEYVFTYFLFNTLIFIITYLLNKVDMSMGAAFGLFAVFSLLRYRTEDISAKEMTYLFLSIALGLINAVSHASWFEICLINGIVLTLTFLLDGNLLMKNEFYYDVQYENLSLIHPDKYEELLNDLRKRTGFNVHQARIIKVDFLIDAAVVRIYYYYEKKKKSVIEK